MYEEFKILISPIVINSQYKYLIDPISTNMIDYIKMFDYPNDLIQTIFKINKKKIESMKIIDTQSREIDGLGHPIITIEDVIYYTEITNLYPSINLYHKNIRTTFNHTSVGTSPSYLEILIDYTYLNSRNKIYIDTLIEQGKVKLIKERNRIDASIKIDCDRDETIGKLT